MTYDQYRQKRFGDLTDAGKKSYNTDSAYKNRRETQWQSEYAQLQKQPAASPASAAPGGYNPGGNFTAPNGTAQGQPTPGTTSRLDSWDSSDLTQNPIMIRRSIPKLLARPGVDPNGMTTNSGTQMDWFYSLHGSDLTHLQDQLEAAGLLTKGSYSRGVPADKDTAAAYMELLKRAFYSNATVDEVLHESQQATSQFGAGGAAGPTKQPLVVQLTNPDDIKKAVKDQAQNTIGRKLTDAEANAFVSLYQGMEKSYQQGVYGATGSGLPGGTGGTFEQPPSLASFTEDQIRQRYPAEAGAHDIANAGSEFFSMLNGGIK